MKNLKTVGIRELKNHLSAYIREVQAGWRILVTDRNKVVAELGEPLVDLLPEGYPPLLIQWAREGKVRLPTRPKTKLPRSPLHFPDGTALALLNEDRGD